MSTVEIEKVDVHRDERGWVSEVYSGVENVEIRNIHLGTMKPGTIRGNHVHEQTGEWISFLQGPVQVCWEEESNRLERVLHEPSQLYFSPGVPHAFRNSGHETVTFAAYTDTRYNEENPDARTVNLLDADG